MSELAKCPACGKFAAGPSHWSADQTVRCPHCMAEFVLRAAVVQSLPQLIPVGTVRTDEHVVETVGPRIVDLDGFAPDPTIRQGTTEPSPVIEPTDLQTSVEKPDARADGPRIEPPDVPPLSPSFAAAYDFPPLEKKQQLDTAAAVAARLRGSPRRHRRWFAELVKIVLGGVLGLALGYWALNYFGGPRFDWLKIHLPGCPHTQGESVNGEE